MFSRTYSVALVLAATAGLVSAQSLSSSCQSVLTGIAADPASSCLNAGGFLTAALNYNSSASLVNPVTSWVTGMCAEGPCNNDTLASVVTNVTAGCSSDLAGIGFATTADDSTLITTIQEGYPTVRKIICLKDQSTSKLCVTEELTTVQSVLGQTLSFPYLFSNFAAIGSTLESNLNSTDVCTDCTKEAWNILNEDFPSIAASYASQVQSECGADFTNGETPSGIQQTAASNNTKSTSSGVRTLAGTGLVGGAMTALLLVSAALFAFA